MPNKKKKTAKGRLDKWYKMAKEQGYRARSAFKLIQLNKKYDFLTHAKCVLDLCAAPGGWLQVATKFMPANHILVGVDLVPIKAIPNCETIVGDITTQKCRTDIKKALNAWKADVVLHDGAPNVGTSWDQDAYTQSELVLASLKLAVEFLRNGGVFVTKIFRSNDYNSLLWVFGQLFKKVEATKPPSSRNTSAEIFVVCEGFLDPKKIDPKLLDPRFVFKELDQPAHIQNVFAKKPGRLPRLGYEPGNVTLFKKASVSEFIDNDQPITMLAQYNQFTFEEGDELYKNHKETVPEILRLCEDLRVLGKGDFKKLLKWRTAMVKLKEDLEEKSGSEDEEEAATEKTPEEEEEELSMELEEKIKGVDKRKKKAKQKLAERRKKFQKRIDMKMVIPGDQLITTEEEGLFQLKNVKDDLVLDSLVDADPDVIVSDEEDVARREKLEQRDKFEQEELANSGDEDDYNRMMEEYLDEMYEEYVSHTLNRTQRIKIGKKKKKEKEEDTLEDLSEDREAKKRKLGTFEPKVSGDVFSSDEEIDLEEPEEKSNSLIVKEETEKVPTSKRAHMWFSQFNGLDDDDDEDAAIQKLKAKLGLVQSKEEESPRRLGPFFKEAKSESEDEGMDAEGEGDSSDSEDEIQETKAKVKLQANGNGKKRIADDSSDSEGSGNEKDEGFEEVPMEKVEDEQGSTDESELDEQSKFYGLALGTMMARDRKARRDMMDDAYNRYAFNDKDLPPWFVDDENKHNTPQLPITKEIVQEMKMKARELNARPIKKVAEAKARKKMKAMKRLEKVKQTAQNIADSNDMTPSEKTRQIENLYKKQAKLGKFNSRAKTYVVTSKSGASKRVEGGKKSAPGRVKHVDKRMKKDSRAEKSKKRGQKRKRH